MVKRAMEKGMTEAEVRKRVAALVKQRANGVSRGTQ